MSAPLEIFCCYAHQDREMLEHLKKHLVSLQRQGWVMIWSDTDLNAGIEWEKELHQHLESANIILLLISPDFMSSDYCYSNEMSRAIERHNEGSARVIPILLRPVHWDNAPFSKLQMIPTNATPVSKWADRDDAFHNITGFIKRLVLESQDQRSFIEANTHSNAGHHDEHYDSKYYPEGMTTIEQPIHPDSKDGRRSDDIQAVENNKQSMALSKKPKVFISYSQQDSAIACKLEKDLRACGVDIWLDQREIKVGDSIPIKVSQGLSESQYVILLMSKASIKSPWVEREWLPALIKEINIRKTTLLPVLLDDCDIPAILQDKRYANFRKSYLRGLSEIVSVFADQLIEENCSRIGMMGALPYSLFETLEAIIEEIRSNKNIEVAPLLNTIIYGTELHKLSYETTGFLRAEIPEWLVGQWRSVKGWNQGDVFTCTSEPHVVGSVGAYGSAIGSFHASLRDGIVRGTSKLREDILLFGWYQETSGTMDGTTGDNGWGILRAKNYNHLEGIWWYRNIEDIKGSGDPKLRAYLWELIKLSAIPDLYGTF